MAELKATMDRSAAGAPPSSGAIAALVAAVSTASDGPGADKPGAVIRPAGTTLGDLVAACDPHELVDLALAQKVAGLASERLARFLDADEQGRLLAQARNDVLRHFAYLGILEGLATALGSAGLPWVVIKGPAVTELAYGATPRGYSDLDLVVGRHELGDAIEALEGAGLVLEDANWPLLVREMTGEVHMSRDGAPFLDLHWHWVNQRRARQRFAIDMDEVLARRATVTLGGASAQVLEPVDFIIHLALHASLSGGHRLGWLLDMERTVAILKPDWDTLVERSRRWKVALPVGVALARTRSTMNAPIPIDVISGLSGGTAGTYLVQRLSPWVPAGHMPGGGSLSNGVTRSLRDSLAATASQVGVEAWEMAQPSKVGTDRGDPRHVFYDCGGAGGRRRYLDMVASTNSCGHLGN
jgi:hypothetical protein